MCAGKRSLQLWSPKVCIRAVYVIPYWFVLQVFSNDGLFKMRFGIRGRTPGQLQRPTGVAVHPNGDIIIADYDNKWVSIFSSEGKFKVGEASRPRI